MKVRSILKLAFAVSLIACISGSRTGTEAASFARQGDAAVPTIRKAFQKYIDDWNAARLDDVFALLAEDFVQMPPDAEPIVGKAGIMSDWRQYMTNYTSEWKPTVSEVTVSEDSAYLRGYFLEKRTPKAGGTTQTQEGDAVWVMRRTSSGEWKLALEVWFSEGWQ